MKNTCNEPMLYPFPGEIKTDRGQITSCTCILTKHKVKSEVQMTLTVPKPAQQTNQPCAFSIVLEQTSDHHELRKGRDKRGNEARTEKQKRHKTVG